MNARHASLLLVLGVVSYASPAAACGGFFCAQQPVDQLAERVVFAVNEEAGTTDMIVQITYSGGADDFAWIVPLGAVPEDGSLATFPQAAMTALDANTVPSFAVTACRADAAMPGGGVVETSVEGGVEVHAWEQVGPYDTAVVESDDPGALVAWLRAHGFRVTRAMEPLIAAYTSEGSVFLALRLTSGSEVSDITPFRMTLPGTAPGIPLRMTALAAEPEMGIVVTVLGSQRYEGANWPNLEIPPSELRAVVAFEPFRIRFNWPEAVARAVDDAGGRGWVTDLAEPTGALVDRLMATPPGDAEQAEAIAALLDLFEGHEYLSRLYTRLSAEEMISDPVFRRSAGGDVSAHDGDFLTDGCELPAMDPCAFMACGAGGRCAEVASDGPDPRAGCACVPGATARTTRGPDGDATVACIDRRMSFVSPGDRETEGALPLPDPCVGFDCGAGTCVSVNMTPTCDCDRGAVAVGSFTDAGERSTSCVAPLESIPASFYEERLSDDPESLLRGPPVPGGGGLGCAIHPTDATGNGLFLVVAFGLFLTRRRHG